jgi:hypothetical protein
MVNVPSVPASSASPMDSGSILWTFTGLRYVRIPNDDQIDLGEGFSLMRPSPAILSARDHRLMSEDEYDDAERCGSYLVLKVHEDADRDDIRAIHSGELHNGLIAFQIIKPIQTSGWTFQSEQWRGNPGLSLKNTERRPPMDPGQWARMREFDSECLAQVPSMISRVKKVMKGTNAARKNTIILLQLALEHMHPLIAGLLNVMGMEAVFDSGDRYKFKSELCGCLGASTKAFPNWNWPTMPQPAYTVDELAIPLYMLRSKLAHGADLRKASVDKSTPVDLVKKVELIPDLEPRTHPFLLAEAACYLHCQVLQKVL